MIIFQNVTIYLLYDDIIAMENPAGYGKWV